MWYLLTDRWNLILNRLSKSDAMSLFVFSPAQPENLGLGMGLLCAYASLTSDSYSEWLARHSLPVSTSFEEATLPGFAYETGLLFAHALHKITQGQGTYQYVLLELQGSGYLSFADFAMYNLGNQHTLNALSAKDPYDTSGMWSAEVWDNLSPCHCHIAHALS